MKKYTIQFLSHAPQGTKRFFQAKTFLGTLRLEMTGDFLTGVYIVPGHPPTLASEETAWEEAPVSLVRAIGNRDLKALPPLLAVGTPFQHKVWSSILAINAGSTWSYEDVAADIGNPKAARAVGHALGQNPLLWLIPCHRVVRKDGSLGGFGAGLPIKGQFLAYDVKGLPF